jgi:DNA invertase Pin-like site-specific DNA recombinase
MMTTVGYARVSSLGQDLAVQLEKLAGCDKLFKEKRSGVDAGRPALAACLEYLREGDTLLVTKLDRLAPFDAGPLPHRLSALREGGCLQGGR